MTEKGMRAYYIESNLVFTEVRFLTLYFGESKFKV